MTDAGQAPGSTGAIANPGSTSAAVPPAARAHVPITVTPAQVAAARAWIALQGQERTAQLLAALQEENRQLRLELGGFLPDSPGPARTNAAGSPAGESPNDPDAA